MKSTFLPVVVLVLLLTSASHCFALMMIADVSKERAKELGITLRSHLNGDAGVAVWIEFKPAGVLKNFTRVELRMTSGGKHLVSAPLQVTRKPDGVVEAYFSADPSQLAGSTLLIAVTDAPRAHIGYELKVSDFVEPPRAR